MSQALINQATGLLMDAFMAADCVHCHEPNYISKQKLRGKKVEIQITVSISPTPPELNYTKGPTK